MKMGTKSVLFGYHQFLLHPFLVWIAWLKIYGWTWDPRVLLGIFLHDLGYIGLPNMDGVEGKQHPWWAADVMHFLFDKWYEDRWHKFCLYHSRGIAKIYFGELSTLGYADKLSFYLYPEWLLKVLYTFSGEGLEYRGTSTIDSTTRLAEPIPWDQWYKEAAAANMKSLKGVWPKCE